MTSTARLSTALAAFQAAFIGVSLICTPTHAQSERSKPAIVGTGDARLLIRATDKLSVMAEHHAGFAKVASLEAAGISPAAQALRVRLAFRGTQSNRPYAIRFVGADGETKWELTPSDLASLPAAFWTPDLGTSRVEIFVHGPQGRPTGLDFDITGLTPVRGDGGTFDSKVGDGFSEDLTQARNSATNPLAKPVVEASRAIGRLTIVDALGNTGSCSGFLISPTKFVTNNHCVSTNEQCLAASAWFGNVRKPDGSIELGQRFDCLKLVDTSAELDFSILELKGTPGATYPILSPAGDNAAGANGDLVVVHHPNGWPQQVSRYLCKLVQRDVSGGTAKSDFSHSCHTSWGSSGSPVLLTSNPKMFVGLHHWGCGKEVCPTGSFNQAVMIERLRARLYP